MVVYADVSEVRRLSGGREEETLPTAHITRAIERSDARVRLWTKKYDWSPTDPDFTVVKEISELLASASIRKGIKDDDDEADEQEEQATKLMESLLASPNLQPHHDTVLLESSVYQSSPANPSGDIYSRGKFIRRGWFLEDEEGVRVNNNDTGALL